MSDKVNQPEHYTQQPVECIEFTQHLNYCMGNAFKYVWRYADKNGVEDLKKAQWYLQRQLAVWPDFVVVEIGLWRELADSLYICEFAIHQYAVLHVIWFATALEKDSARTVLEDALDQLSQWIGDDDEQL